MPRLHIMQNADPNFPGRLSIRETVNIIVNCITFGYPITSEVDEKGVTRVVVWKNGQRLYHIYPDQPKAG